MENEDLDKAEDRINEIINLGKEIEKASPFLTDMKSKIGWMKKVRDTDLNEKDKVLTNFNSSIDYINGLKSVNDFTYSWATGSTAIMSAATFDSTADIQTTNPDKFDLIKGLYDSVNNENKINSIINVLESFPKPLCDHFKIAIEAKAKWDLGLRSDSELAGEMRTFINSLTGHLNNIRINNTENLKGKTPDFSWIKVFDFVGKNGSSKMREWRSQQKPYETIVQELTWIFKKKKQVSKDSIELTYNQYLDWIFSSINLLDEQKIK